MTIQNNNSVQKFEKSGDFFRQIGLGQLIDSGRRNQMNRFEPWLEKGNFSKGLANDFFQANHLNKEISQGLSELELDDILNLVNCGFVELHDEQLAGGQWRVTHHNGIYCVADVKKNGISNVYAGDDSLLFSDFLLTLPKSSKALDIGSGTGISTVAIARNCAHVTGMDVVPECVDAGVITSALNGYTSRTTFLAADLESFIPDARYEVIAANPPGVPVPPTIFYGFAGNGGSDGLDLVRAILGSCEDWCTKDGLVCMRFQSICDGNEARIYQDIRNIAQKLNWDVTLLADIRVPIELRSALTACNALTLNAESSVESLMRSIDLHMVELNARSYTSTLMLAKMSGRGQVTTQSTHSRIALDTAIVKKPRINTNGENQFDEVLFEWLNLLGTLPGIFWKLGGNFEINRILEDHKNICKCLLHSSTSREAFNHLYPQKLSSINPKDRAMVLPFLLVAEALFNTKYIEERG